MRSLPACIAALLAAILAGSPSALAEDGSPTAVDAAVMAAWRTLRAVDCARCHGREYEGLAAPSIVTYARTQSREMFVRTILDGEPTRGMPGYRDNPRVAESIDDIYRYFLGRANGTIESGSLSRPKSTASP